MSDEVGEVVAVAQTFRNIPVGLLRESPSNPRQHFDPKKLEELTASVRSHGVRTPLLVRPTANGHEGYEIGAGHRRFRAALEAGLAEVPAVIRPMGDTEFLELLTFENLQREDVHPLEEAEGYRALIKSKSGYDVAKIGDRVGKSAKYVYDRLKLLELTPAAQKLFRDGMITAGHAILLARLTPKDQARAIDSHGALLETERRVWDPAEARASMAPKKPVSVREFSDWIDKNVRFDAAAPDPMLFPETAATIEAVREEEEKLVPITLNHYVPPEAKDGSRTFGPASWKRADGKSKSKACPSAVTGVIVVGPGRGEAFKVCIAKKDCRIHWASEIRKRDRSTTGAAASSRDAEQERWKRDQERDRLERERRAAEGKRWEAARPAILKALSERLKKIPVATVGRVALQGQRPHSKDLSQYLDFGSGAEALLRSVAFLVMYDQLVGWDAMTVFPRAAGAIGLDVKSLLGAADPAPVVKASTKQRRGASAKA